MTKSHAIRMQQIRGQKQRQDIDFGAKRIDMLWTLRLDQQRTLRQACNDVCVCS